MIVALTSDTLTRGQMYDAVITVITQRLSQVDGIGQVSIGGGALPAVRIELDPNRLAANGIALDSVRATVVASNANRPKGAVEDADRYWQLGANDQSRTAADYAPIILSYRNGAAVRLRDVADVTDSVQDVRNDGLSNGRPAVLLILSKAPGANVIKTVDKVRSLLPQLRASISPAINVDVVMDRAPPPFGLPSRRWSAPWSFLSVWSSWWCLHSCAICARHCCRPWRYRCHWPVRLV